MLRRAGRDDGLAYSPERKAAVLAKMLPPNNMPLGRLAKEEGISVATLSKWRAEARAKGQFLPDANAGPEGWNSEDKLAAVIGERLRRHRFETNRDRVAERGGAWRVLPPPRHPCRAAGCLA
jgi:transposase-like protein